MLEEEKYYGNIEYKLKLANPTMDRVQHLTTQMIFRLEVALYSNLLAYRKVTVRLFTTLG